MAINWLQQKVTVPEEVTDDHLKNIFMDRAITIANEPSHRNTLVEWHLLTTGAVNQDLRAPERRKQLVDWLRTEFGSGQEPWLWTTDLRIEPPEFLPQEWYEEDTILGEYLRAIETFRNDDSQTVALHDYLPVPLSKGPGTLTDLTTITAEHRAEVFRQSVMLGVDCMGPLTARPGRGPNIIERSSTDH